MSSERIAVIGLWHLGTVTAACLAELGHDVVGWDPDPRTVADLAAGRPPLYELGLEELVAKHGAAGRLRFTDDLHAALTAASFVFLSHDTPVDDRDEIDLSLLRTSVRAIAAALPAAGAPTLVIQSQVPTGTCDSFAAAFARRGRRLRVACLPENLRLGRAIEEFMHPDRYVIGAADAETAAAVRRVLAPLGVEPITTDLRTAEMAKHATNALLAAAICFGNELSEMCEAIGADGRVLSRILLTDRRIGPRLPLKPGLSFSGGTLARDLRILAGLGRKTRRPLCLVNSILRSNEEHRRYVVQRIAHCLRGRRAPRVAALGLVYKAGTSTLRRSLPLAIVRDLARAGARVQAHDPHADPRELPRIRGLSFSPDPYEAMTGADAVVFLTDWPEFKQLDFAHARRLVRRPVAVDLRNMFENELAQAGFRHIRCGVGGGDAQ